MKILWLFPLLLTGCLFPGTQRLFPENKNVHADEVTLTTPYGGIVLRNIDSVVSSNFTKWPKPAPLPTTTLYTLTPEDVEKLKELLQKVQ